MSNVLVFIKEWVPALGVLIGTTWLVLRWAIEQKIRGLHEMPALTGEVSSATMPLNDQEKLLLSVEVNWTSTSPRPLYVDPERTRFDLFEVPRNLDFGGINPKNDLGVPLYQLYPLSDMGDFVFEPKTNNQLRAFFVIEAGLYVVRSKVYRDTRHHGKKLFAWTREHLVDARIQSGTEAGNAETANGTESNR